MPKSKSRKRVTHRGNAGSGQFPWIPPESALREAFSGMSIPQLKAHLASGINECAEWCDTAASERPNDKRWDAWRKYRIMQTRSWQPKGHG